MTSFCVITTNYESQLKIHLETNNIFHYNLLLQIFSQNLDFNRFYLIIDLYYLKLKKLMINS